MQKLIRFWHVHDNLVVNLHCNWTVAGDVLLWLVTHINNTLWLVVDNGHAFDQVLFYGQELTLTTFEVLLFALVDMFSNQGFVLSAIIVYFCGLVCITHNSMFNTHVLLPHQPLPNSNFTKFYITWNIVGLLVAIL